MLSAGVLGFGGLHVTSTPSSKRQSGNDLNSRALSGLRDNAFLDVCRTQPSSSCPRGISRRCCCSELGSTFVNGQALEIVTFSKHSGGGCMRGIKYLLLCEVMSQRGCNPVKLLCSSVLVWRLQLFVLRCRRHKRACLIHFITGFSAQMLDAIPTTGRLPKQQPSSHGYLTTPIDATNAMHWKRTLPASKCDI